MENNFKVNMNEYLPLRDVVFNTLRQAILKGELAPGERLMEIQLAEKLGVSRTPIREAIRKLELEGLVLMIPRKGAEVAKISEKSLRDVLEVRRSLEELAIELACQRMSEEDRLPLRAGADLLYLCLSCAHLRGDEGVERHCAGLCLGHGAGLAAPLPGGGALHTAGHWPEWGRGLAAPPDQRRDL